MRFSTVAVAVLPVGVALAQQTFNVTVGMNATLTFTPNQISGVNTGDTINFIFAAGNHTATQSSFANPCSPLLTDGQPLSTGFQFVTPGTTSGFPLVAVTLANVTGPLWFYCEQTTPKNHCQTGMVFAVNPTADKSFAAFQANAQGAAANSTTSTNSTASVPAGSPSSAPPTVSSGGASDSGTPSPTDTSSGSSSSDSTNPSTSNSGTSPSPTQTNGAISARAGTAGVLLAGVAALVALAL